MTFTHDLLDRVVSRNADAFTYNPRSEVISATISNTVAAYVYDGIGNRLAATNNAVATFYASTPLNQYAQISVPSVPSVDTLSYDPDGNLLTNGVWSYSWDAENRLVAAYSNATLVVSNAYDHAHRRVLKVTPAATHTYLYDGWNLIRETIHNQQSSITNLFVWGKDLSGTLQGAGGVGGLLVVSVAGVVDPGLYFPFYDHNGNITAYVDESGDTVASYTYDAFGQSIARSGPMADAFPHRFSTKYFDSETGLYYYGYRFYSPELGRWMNRDPIKEDGGLNLYAFVGNDPLSWTDALGEAQVGKWIEPGADEGWAIVGTGRFPGPGWSGEFRGRPATLFDFAAKLHDLHYALNDIKFGAVSGTVGHGVPFLRERGKALSRKAKADYIFRKMNDVGTGGGVWVGFVNWAARAAFYDDPKYFCRNDDFANALLQPETPRLARPEEYLMIPYSHLKEPRPTIAVVKHWKGIPDHPLTKTFTFPDYMGAANEDHSPGWWMWAESVYGETWRKIQEITDATDSSFKW